MATISVIVGEGRLFFAIYCHTEVNYDYGAGGGVIEVIHTLFGLFVVKEGKEKSKTAEEH